MKKIIRNIFVFILACLFIVSCAKKTGKKGTYMEVYGILGTIQLNNDGTFYYDGGVLSNGYISSTGKYTLKDGKLKFETDKGSMSFIEYLTTEWTYDKEEDTIYCEFGDTKYIWSPIDKDLEFKK